MLTAEELALQVMLVNFYAPWCHWCQRLEPVWEKSAAAVGEKHPGVDIILAKVNACFFFP
jgi:thiol-disulfide isomerase/thioredoxin